MESFFFFLQGDYQSNVPTGEDSLHAVTWGVFPGKEYEISHFTISITTINRCLFAI